MITVDWYFDFISPFSYLQAARIDALSRRVKLRPKPVLFAALLDHYGQLGPAEIAPKREFIFRQALWLAQRNDIDMRLPPSHPFNPLPALRLALALESHLDPIRRIFEFIWREGRDIGDAAEFQRLAGQLGIADATACIAQSAVKDALRANTTLAIEQGVFGVPTLVADGERFWGFDAGEFLLEFLDQPQQVRARLFDPVARLAHGEARRRKAPQ